MPSKFKMSAEYLLAGLAELGLNIDDPNFVGTPDRIERAYNEIFSGVNNTEEQVKEILKTAFPSTYTGIILEKGIKAFSMCPHHFLPVEYEVDVAYIPGETGDVLGISKLIRLTEILARRPVLQEQFGDDITDALMQIGAAGAACIASGKHFCMRMRGVKQQSDTITSSVKGVFMDKSAARNELMLLLK